MRIISGNFRGKKIIEPNDKKTRPLKDLTKESIFNIIAHSNKFEIKFENSSILDLFSGVGSFGIECLSRNVKYVTFVEKYNGVLNILKKNLSNLKKIDNYEVIEKDIYDKSFFLKIKKNFDIIFLDPPYKDNKLKDILMNIYSSKCLNKNGIIIIHRHKNEQDMFTENFKIIEQKIYGLSKIIFLSF
mgnify:FL=1